MLRESLRPENFRAYGGLYRTTRMIQNYKKFFGCIRDQCVQRRACQESQNNQYTKLKVTATITSVVTKRVATKP